VPASPSVYLDGILLYEDNKLNPELSLGGLCAAGTPGDAVVKSQIINEEGASENRLDELRCCRLYR
jgi:hypothetical protein